MPVSATLAANEVTAARRRRGLPMLPLAFGEAGLPVHPALRGALAAATACNGYGPVAGHPACGSRRRYWTRRACPPARNRLCPARAASRCCSALLLALGGDVALPGRPGSATPPRPPHRRARDFVPAAGRRRLLRPGAAGAPPSRAAAPRAADRVVVVTMPDNPTGPLARPDTVRALCAVAERHGLVISPMRSTATWCMTRAAGLLSPAQVAPERTVVTTGLSKSLAAGRLADRRRPDARWPLGGRLAEP